MFTSPASSNAGSAAFNWLRRGTTYVLLGARCLPPSISVHCHHQPAGRCYQSCLTYKEPEKWSDKQQSWDRKPGFLNIKHKQSHWAVLGLLLLIMTKVSLAYLITRLWPLHAWSLLYPPPCLCFSIFSMNLSCGKFYLITFYHLKVIVTLPLNGEKINTVDSWTTRGLGVPTPMQWNFRV